MGPVRVMCYLTQKMKPDFKAFLQYSLSQQGKKGRQNKELDALLNAALSLKKNPLWRIYSICPNIYTIHLTSRGYLVKV